MLRPLPSSKARRAGAFTLVELLAAIAIVAILVATIIPWVGNYVAYARDESNKHTLMVLNDALTRYKTEGGDVTLLTQATTVGGVLNKLATPVTWNGLTHQFLKESTASGINAASLASRGTGKTYRFTDYAGTSTEATAAFSPTNVIVSTFPQPVLGSAMCFDAAGKLWVVGAGTSYKVDTTAGTVTAQPVGISGLHGITLGPDNYLYASENNRILRIDPATGNSTVYAGTGANGAADGPRLAATFSSPRNMSTDSAGNLYVVDWSRNTVRKIDTAGNVTTPFPITPNCWINAMGYGAAQGKIYVLDLNYCRVFSLDTTTLAINVDGGWCARGIATAGSRIYWANHEGTVRYTDNNFASTNILVGLDTEPATIDGSPPNARLQKPTGIAIDGQGVLWVLQPASDYDPSGTPCLRKISLQ